MCGALKLSGIVRANVRLNIAIAMLFWSLKIASTIHEDPSLGPSTATEKNFISVHTRGIVKTSGLTRRICQNRFLSSKGVGESCGSPYTDAKPSPTLDKNIASMGPGFLSSIGVGVWRKAPEAFPGSNTTLDTFQSASICQNQ